MARELYVNVRRGLIQTTGPSPKRKEEEKTKKRKTKRRRRKKKKISGSLIFGLFCSRFIRRNLVKHKTRRKGNASFSSKIMHSI
jgi:hypothetical protein